MYFQFFMKFKTKNYQMLIDIKTNNKLIIYNESQRSFTVGNRGTYNFKTIKILLMKIFFCTD